MECTYCRFYLCARTEKQLQHRLRIMDANPRVKPAPCPHCGTTAWARSREAIEDDPRPWWKQLFDVRLW